MSVTSDSPATHASECEGPEAIGALRARAVVRAVVRGSRRRGRGPRQGRFPRDRPRCAAGAAAARRRGTLGARRGATRSRLDGLRPTRRRRLELGPRKDTRIIPPTAAAPPPPSYNPSGCRGCGGGSESRRDSEIQGPDEHAGG